MGRREEDDARQATTPRECGQWRGTSEFRVGVRGLPAALAAYLNQEQSLTPYL
jgi:hypothetical protein